MNFENLKTNGLVEMSSSELEETNGGMLWYVAIAVGVAIASATEIISDWDNFKNGLTGSPEVK